MGKRLRGQGGFSLVSLLVAAGVSGVLLLALTRGMDHLMRSNKHVEIRGQLESLRRKVRNAMSCRETTGTDPAPPYAACANTDYVLRNHRGEELFGANGVVGNTNLQVRAFCATQADGLQVEVRRIQNGNVLDDPLTRQQMDYRPLFDIGLCDQYFGKNNPAQCNGDLIMVGVGPDGEPICESIYNRLQYQVCLQFNDSGCSDQDGPVQCTPCLSNLANLAEIESPFAHDSNQYDPDCARLFVKKCGSHTNTAVTPNPPSSDSGDILDTQQVTGNSESDCDAIACPNGYVATAWGAHVTNSDIVTCSLTCVLIAP